MTTQGTIKQVLDIQDKAQDVIKTVDVEQPPFSGTTPKETRRAIQTFFRSSFRVQMGMVSLADRKANILIRLNSLLISGMVIFYKNITTYNEMATISVVIFLVTLGVSLIFATLAVTPSSELVSDTELTENDTAGQMFMYTHYVKMKPLQFEKNFDKMMRKSNLIYGSMARDLYQFGKVIVRKYQLLKIAYTTFTVGLIITIVLFLSAILFK